MEKEKTISVLVVESGKTPKVVQIDNTLRAKQDLVGGYIEAICPYDDPVAIVCNEEGKLTGLPYNRSLKDETGDIYDVIAGTFFICGLSGDNFASLGDDLIAKYQHMFYYPEEFISTEKGILVVPVDPEGENT